MEEVGEMEEVGRCPYCDGWDTECIGNVAALEDNYLVEQWICFDCEKNWNEFYKRTGEVELLD